MFYTKNQLQSLRKITVWSKGFFVALLILFTACSKSKNKRPVIITPKVEVQECKEGTQLIFEEGFESGELNLKVSGDRSNPPEVIQSETARRGNYVMKSQLSSETAEPYRTEITLNKSGLLFEPQKEYWVGISTKLDEDFNLSHSLNDQGMIFQWHYHKGSQGVPDAQPLVGRYRDGKVYIQCELLDDYLASTPANFGEWVDWVIHVKFDNKEGVFEVWWNGNKVVDWTGDNHQEERANGSTYMKFGLYSSQYRETNMGPLPKGQSRTVYHDEVRIAGKEGCYELVAPKH